MKLTSLRLLYKTPFTRHRFTSYQSIRYFKVGNSVKKEEKNDHEEGKLVKTAGDDVTTTNEDKEVDKAHPQWHLTIRYENEHPKPGGRKRVFGELVKTQSINPIYTLEEAAAPAETHRQWVTSKYPSLEALFADREYHLRGVDNKDTYSINFPDTSDYLIIGSGLVGSATAYYIKKHTSKSADCLVLDKTPYSPHTCTAMNNGLLSSQSKSRDISRVSSISKELIRELSTDVMMTEELFSLIKYRPCSHLILWPETEVDEVLKSIENQHEDGLYTEAKLPLELEETFPFLRVSDTDVALGSYGCQDEALVDPIGLRNVYRSLAQAHGAAFIRADVVDFNTNYNKLAGMQVDPNSARMLAVRIPSTGELNNISFAGALLSLGHNTPFLEARAEMESFYRDQIGFLHSVQPKIRIQYIFQSLSAPIIDFPVITDTDGSILIRNDHGGNFKYCLNYEDSESFLDFDVKFMDFESEDPFLNLYHKSPIFEEYFNDVIKPRLTKRIPCMVDAKFVVAISGYESHNEHDGSPIIGLHPYHTKVHLSAGYGSRLMMYGPAAAKALSELMIYDTETTYDMNNFYFNRIVRNRKIEEFEILKR